MSDGGKGSKPRPLSVSVEEYNNRWDAIFARDNQDEIDGEMDKLTRNNEETQQALTNGKAIPISEFPGLSDFLAKGLALGKFELS